jgi:predicted ATPase
MAALARLLAPRNSNDTRLVTLTGPGGSGKTRLAVEVAAREHQTFGGAIWFVSLADLADPRLIPGAIAGALGVPHSPTSDLMDQIVAALAAGPRCSCWTTSSTWPNRASPRF